MLRQSNEAVVIQMVRTICPLGSKYKNVIDYATHETSSALEPDKDIFIRII